MFNSAKFYTTLLLSYFCLIYFTVELKAQNLETFESIATNATSFTNNSVTFNLTPVTPSPGFSVNEFTDAGYLSSHKFIDNIIGPLTNPNPCQIKSTSLATFYMKSLYFYPSEVWDGFPNQTTNVNVTFTGNLDGAFKFSYTPPSTDFAAADPIDAINRGFSLVDFATPGYDNTQIDELVITLGGTTIYFAIDNFNFAFAGVLPVELTTFTANLNSNKIDLNWETATEINNYGFEIERQKLESANKNTEWNKLGFIEGHGNSNSPKHYSFTDKSVQTSGKYFYRLKQIDIDGTFEYSDVVEANMDLPEKFELNQNYPNPFNPTTSISYSIPVDGNVKLSVFNVLGKEVAIIEEGFVSAGIYSKVFDASDLTSGIYFYTIRANNFVETKKMILMK